MNNAQTPRRRWVTMSDVAEHAGVAKITVSRTLRIPDLVHPDTRERVLRSVEALGYLPDAAACSLSSRESRMIGALFPGLADAGTGAMVGALTLRLQQDRYQLLIATSGTSPQSGEELTAALLGRRPDAFVTASALHDTPPAKLLSRAGVPVVELGDLPAHPIDAAVGFCSRKATRQMVRYLLDRGYSRPALLTAGPGPARCVAQAAGFTEALSGKAEIRMFCHTPNARDGADATMATEPALSQVLRQWPDTDALLCATDELAAEALFEAMRRGLSIPKQIAIAGLGGAGGSGSARGLGLTTIDLPDAAIGEAAAALILRRLSGHAGPGEVIDLGARLEARETA